MTLDGNQFSYQHSRSVEDALLTVMNSLTKHLDKSPANYARILYADFSSAFNAMNTNSLIKKLCNMNLPEYLINWFKNFLLERPQYVKMGSNISTTRSLSNGCPQGCVSSPVLYILYTNDCVSTFENCSLIKYADDTAILGLLNDKDSENNYFDQITRFVHWCKDNFLELNVSKTKEQVFDFRNSKTLPYCNIKIDNQDVEIVKHFKYLGVTINDSLNFKPHVANISKKLCQRLHILRKLRSFEVSKKTMVQVYNSLILSIITFSLTMWYGGCGVKEKAKIQKIIREAGKIMNHKLKSLEHHYTYAVERKAFSIIDDKKHSLKHEFILLPSGRRYLEMKCRTNRYKSTFIPSAIRVVNKVKSNSKSKSNI